jgi:hypothetical protein
MSSRIFRVSTTASLSYGTSSYASWSDCCLASSAQVVHPEPCNAAYIGASTFRGPIYQIHRGCLSCDTSGLPSDTELISVKLGLCGVNIGRNPHGKLRVVHGVHSDTPQASDYGDIGLEGTGTSYYGEILAESWQIEGWNLITLDINKVYDDIKLDGTTKLDLREYHDIENEVPVEDNIFAIAGKHYLYPEHDFQAYLLIEYTSETATGVPDTIFINFDRGFRLPDNTPLPKDKLLRVYYYKREETPVLDEGEEGRRSQVDMATREVES